MQVVHRCNFCTAENCAARGLIEHHVPAYRIGCPPEPKPVLVPSSKSVMMLPFLFLSGAVGTVQRLPRFFFASHLPCVTQPEPPQVIACDPWWCRSSAIDNFGRSIPSHCNPVAVHLPVMLVEHCSPGHSQGWDSIDTTRVGSGQTRFDSHELKEKSFDSRHSCPPGSSRSGCMRSN